MARTILRAAALSALLLACAAASPAQHSTLGADGMLYTARVGAYGGLFPSGGEQDADANVIALEIRAPDGTLRRLLAPSGGTVPPDATPYLVWEDSSRRLFMVWEGLSHIHSAVRLSSFDGTDWSEPLQISGNPFTRKSSPRLAVTRETYLRGGLAENTTGERTVLHVVWYEDDYGTVDVLYAPVVLDNGTTPAWLPPIFDLAQFVPQANEGGNVATPTLLRNPRVVAAADGQSVLVALVDDGTHQLVTFRVDVLPVELSAMADELARFLAEVEDDPCTGDLAKLAARARAHLVVIGTRFSTYARSYLADTLRDWLLARREGECSTGGVTGLAERARAHLVVIGRRALREVIVAADAESSVLLTFDGEGAGLHNDLSLSVQRAVVSPPALGPGAARIHVAGSGRGSLVSWLGKGHVFYQEHDGAAWLPAQSLALSDDFTLDRAYALLDDKAR